MPADWSFVNNGFYVTSSGGRAVGDTYSYGTNLVAERALGELSSANTRGRFGAKFQNAGNSSITKILSLSYRGEQWRFGGVHGETPDKLVFQYSLNAPSLSLGTWFFIDALEFRAPVTAGTVGALDGNASPNFTNLSIGNTTLNTPVAPGGTFWIRWLGVDVDGDDDGLSIDDFSITAIPEPNIMALFAIGVLVSLILLRRRQLNQTANHSRC